MSKKYKYEEKNEFNNFNNSIFKQESFNKNTIDDDIEAIYEQKQINIINTFLELIELKRENSFLKNQLKNLEKILNKNLIDKYTQKDKLEINLWMISDKDKKIKEKIKIYALEMKNNINKVNIKQKKKKIKIKEISANEESKDNYLNNNENDQDNSERIFINSDANVKIKSDNKKEINDEIKSFKINIEDFSVKNDFDSKFDFQGFNNFKYKSNKNDNFSSSNNNFDFELQDKQKKRNNNS